MSVDDDKHRELRDLAYTALGFGLLRFQRLQVARQDLRKKVRAALRPTPPQGPPR